MPRLAKLVVTALVVAATASVHGQAPETMSVDAVLARVTKSEASLIGRLRELHPIVEVYVQSLSADAVRGGVPARDDYFLGQFDGSERPSLTSLSPQSGSFHDSPKMTSVQYLPRGFAATTVPDWQPLDTQRYAFAFVRREFLGELRTLVFDVQPKPGAGHGFEGRIWVEDRDYTIVRFNGLNRNVDLTMTTFFTMTRLYRKKLPFHIDSWRVNVSRGVWLPAYVYCEEVDLEGAPRIKSQMRLWGYQTKKVGSIDAPARAGDGRSATDRQLSPVQSQRLSEQQAEANAVDRLDRVNLLAPVGSIDAMLETVLHNLQVTNNVALDAPVKARVLLTQPLEAFTIGHTIVISRGLIDVLPDEGSLAMVLAHELAHVALGHLLVDTRFAFADRLVVSDGELLRTLSFRHPKNEELAADSNAVAMLANSPYKDRLAGAGLFLKAVSANAKALTNLIQPHVGDFGGEGGQSAATIVDKAPPLEPERLDQIAVLPLGARLVVDPWTDRVELLRAEKVPLAAAREKVPLAITPLMPFLRYSDAASPTPSPQ